MATSKGIHWLGILGFLVCFSGVLSKPLPQGTVTQSGEPSHFQVDDKSAEIEVNANPAGVKVNAKPASLQVVAKPGTPAIPVYHPAIHVAPHYLPPPIIHREPAMFYEHRHHHHCHPPYCFGRSRGWFYAGLRRDDLPKPVIHRSFTGDAQSDKSSRIPRPYDRDSITRGLDDRDSLGRKLDYDGNVVSRNHKSSILRPEKEHKQKGSHKRQFIAGIPQSYQPQGMSALGSPGYALQPYSAMLGARAPLARNIISSYGGAPMGLGNYGTGSYGAGSYGAGSYGASALSSLYNQQLSNSALGGSNLGQASQGSLGSLRMYGGYGGTSRSQLSPSMFYGSPSYSPGAGPKSNIMNSFMQSEINHELYGSSATPSPQRFEQGYSRSIMGNPYEQQPSGYGSLLSGRSLGGMGGMGGPLGGLYQPRYQGGLFGNYGNSAMMQLARLYASQPLASTIPGMQQYSDPRQATPQLSYPYMAGGSSMIQRSKVPGSKSSTITNKKSDIKNDKKEVKNRTLISPKQESVKFTSSEQTSRKDVVTDHRETRNEGEKEEKKSRKKRQLLADNLGGYDLDALQDALVNEVKREMILGAPAEPPPIAALTDAQSSLGLPLPGIEPMPAARGGDLLGLQQMAALDANYIAPIQRFNPNNPGNPVMRSQALTSMALGRSQVSPDQLRMLPSMPQRMQAMPSRFPQAPVVRQMPQQLPQQQGFIQNRPNGFIQNGNEFIGSPLRFNEGYRSPIEYDKGRRPRRFKRPGQPLYRRRLHHRYYDDDDDYDDSYRERRPLYHEHLGRDRISIGGSYSESEVPNSEGETLVDTSNHGFGPITVEAKTAEGLKKSLWEDKRGDIIKPKIKQENPVKTVKKKKIPFSFGVL